MKCTAGVLLLTFIFMYSVEAGLEVIVKIEGNAQTPVYYAKGQVPTEGGLDIDVTTCRTKTVANLKFNDVAAFENHLRTKYQGVKFSVAILEVPNDEFNPATPTVTNPTSEDLTSEQPTATSDQLSGTAE